MSYYAPTINENILQYQSEVYRLWGRGLLFFSTVTASGVLGNSPVVLVDATAGPISLTLPAASGSKGRQYLIKKTDSSANAITLTGTIDGVVNDVLTAQYAVAWIFSDGTSWFRLNPPTFGI